MNQFSEVVNKRADGTVAAAPSASGETNGNAVQRLEMTLICPGDNDRRVFDERKLRELAASIQEHGLAQPITVRPSVQCPLCGPLHTEPPLPVRCAHCGHDELAQRYQIVAGERRFRAHQLLERATIPALVRSLDDEQAAGIMLAENVHREDLNPLDEAHAYAKRVEEFEWSVARVAREAQVSEGRVRSRLALLALHPEAQHLVTTGDLPLGHAEDLAALDHNRQLMALAWLREQKGMPPRVVFSRVVGEYYAEQVQEGLFDLDALFAPEVLEAVDEAENGRLDEILPTRPELPDLPTKIGGIGVILDEYAAHLLETGHDEAAEVVIDLWVKLMRANYGKVPALESATLAAVSNPERRIHV